VRTSTDRLCVRAAIAVAALAGLLAAVAWLLGSVPGDALGAVRRRSTVELGAVAAALALLPLLPLRWFRWVLLVAATGLLGVALAVYLTVGR